MKKHYLISFIGIMLISISIGNCFSTLNSKLLNFNKDEINSNGTGLTIIEDESKIIFYDTNNNDKLDSGDNPESFSLTFEFDQNNHKWSYEIPSINEYGLNLYSCKENDSNPELLQEVTYAYLFDISENGKAEIEWDKNLDSKVGRYIIQVNNIDSNEDKFSNIWNYEYETNEEFLITADYYSPIKEEQYLDEEIGKVETKVSKAEKTTIEQVGEVDVISPTEAKVNYVLNPGKDVEGRDLDIEEISWINTDNNDVLVTSTDLTQKTLTAEGLEKHKTYNNTTLKVYGSTPNELLAETEVEPFTTLATEPEEIKINEILIDSDHNYLEIKGTIDTNGSTINEKDLIIKKIVLNNKTKKQKEQEYIEQETYVYSWTQDGDTITYDIFTNEYIFLDEGINKSEVSSMINDNIFVYAIEVNSILDGSDNTPQLFLLKDFILAKEKETEITRNKDLSYLESSINKNSIKLDPGEIVGITIAFLFFTEVIIAGIIILIGNILYRRVQSKYSVI